MSELTLSIKLTTAGGKIVVKEIGDIGQAAKQAFDGLQAVGKAGPVAGAGLDKAGRGAKGFKEDSLGASDAVDKLAGHMHRMVGIGTLFYGAMKLIGGVKVAADIADEFNVLEQRVKTATKETHDFNAVWTALYANAQKNGAAIQSTVELFQRLSTSRKELKATNDDFLEFTDTVQMLGVIGGSSTEAMKYGLVQLSQAMSSQVVRAEEFNSILENIPELAVRIANGLGVSTGQLRKLVLEGKVLSADVFDAILKQTPEIAKEFDNLPISLGRAGVAFDSAMASALSRLDQASGATQSWADLLQLSASVLDDMDGSELQNTVAAMLAVAGGSAALLILSRYGIGLLSVAGGYKALTGWLGTFRTAQVATTTTMYNAATMTNLTVVSNTAAARSFNILAASAGLARGALGVLGGPLGLAMLAGSAIYYFANASDSATASVEELLQPVDKLTDKFKQLNNDQQAASLVKWGVAQKQAIEDADKAFQDLIGSFGAWDFSGLNNSERTGLVRSLAAAKQAGEALVPILQQVGQDAGVSPEKIASWVTLAGTYSDAKAKAEQAKQALDALQQPAKKTGSGNESGVTENKELTKALLDLYNAQMLAASAVDSYGSALSGVDLALFKAQFVDAKTLPDDAAAAIKRYAEQAKKAAATLNIDNHVEQLEKENGLLLLRLQLGEAEFAIQKALAQFTGVDPARLEQLEKELKLQQSRQALISDRDALAALIKENDLLQVRLASGEKEYEIQKALAALKGADPAVLEAIEAELRLRQDLTNQISISEEITSGAFNKALDEMSALSSAGNSFGDALTQAFGRVAQQIDGMAAAQVNYNQKLDELKKKRKEVEALEANDPARAKALIDIKNKEAALTKENFQAQLGQFSALSGAASQMFGEQSKEREALHKLEMAFGVAEIAMSMQKAGANALTAITSAFSAPFPLNFAAGAAMIAIMAGLGVFSGGSSASVPSAADRQASQGTGTVFGDTDAKSESIANALERIESLELDQYSELREINANIKSLSAGIANLAVSLVGNYGKFNEDNYAGELGTVKRFGNQAFVDFTHKLDKLSGGIVGAVDKLLGGALSDIAGSIIGGISKTTKKLLDSGISFDAQELGDILATGLVEGSYYNVIETTKRKLWGLSKKAKQNTEYSELDNALEAEFGRIFSSIGNSITAAVDMLGVDTTKLLENFVIDLPALSFKDLSGDEIQAELEAIFSAQADLMVQYLVPAIGEYQQMGEGLYETLIRVAQEQAVFNAQLDALGLGLSRFGDVAAETQIAIAQSIIELMGGIEEFRDATSQYFSSFFSETEQFEYLSKSLSLAVSDLGVALPATRDGFKDLISSIDITTEAGAALYAALMSLIPGLDAYYKSLEQQKEAAERAAEAERKLAEQRAAYNASNQSELARFDMSPLQLAIDDLNKWYREAAAEAQELGADTSLLWSIYNKRKENLAEKTLQQAIDTANNAMTRLVADYARASDALQSTLEQQTNAINGMVSSIAGTISSIQQTLPGFDNVAFLRGRVAELAGSVGSGSIDEQLSKAGELQSAIQARYNAELAANRELQSAAQGRYDALASELSTLQSDFESAGNALRDAFDQVVDRIAGAAKSVAQTATQIRLSMPGANAAGYYASLVSSLRGQLGGGDIDSQLTLVSELQNAIQARYNAELQQLEQVQQVADEQYQLQLDQYNTALSTYRELAKAAEALRDAAAALQIGDLSPLTTGERLRETQSQLQQAMQAALGGDANAYGDVQQLGQRYLELARDFNPASYQGAFDYITSLFDQLGGTTFAEPTAPRPHPDTTAFEQQQISLAEAALAELAQLQQFTQALEATAANTLHNDLTALESTYNANTAAVNAQMQQLQNELVALEQQQIVLAQGAISELARLQSTVAGLQTLANAEYAAGVEALKAQFASDSAAITAVFESELAALKQLMPAETDRVVAKLQEQIDAIYKMSTDITGAIRETPAAEVIVTIPEIKVPPITLPPELFDPITKRKPDETWPDPTPILSDIRNELQQQREQTADIAQRQQFMQEQQNQQMVQLTEVTERFGREVVDLSAEQLTAKRAIA